MALGGFFASKRSSLKAYLVLFAASISAISYSYTASLPSMFEVANLAVMQPTTWISLSVCTDGSTHLHGKANTPFVEFALIASQLWIQQLSVRVILQLVSKEGNSKLPPHMKDIPTTMLIKELKSYENMSCHTSSQLARMFAHEYAEVKPWDIVITADADALPCSQDILKPTSSLRYKAWIWQHFYSEESGNTFPMSFIGLRATDWQKLLCASRKNSRDCANHWLKWDKSTFNESLPTFTWGLDQRIVTRTLLEQRICYVGNRAVWNHVKLDYNDFLDIGTCFHGQRINAHVDNGGNSWVHMYPDSTLKDAQVVARMALSSKGCPRTSRRLSKTNSLE